MRSFNLSEWALQHRSFVWYLIIVCIAAGAFSYVRLGRDENPPFTLKAMVVQIAWPGATVEETMLQITDRVERKLQETPWIDYLKSYTKPGSSTVFVWLKDPTPVEAVPDIWYQVRKKIGDMRATLPAGIQGPFFNDEFGETFGTIYAFTADGFSQRELRDHVEDVRSGLLGVEDVAKINLVGAQDERIFVEFDMRRIAGLGVDPRRVVETLQAQNAVAPAGVVQTADEKILLRVSGQFVSERSLEEVTLYADGRLFRLSDVATIRRGYADPPQPLFRFNGQPAIGLAISMAEGGNILRFGEAIKARVAAIGADLPIGIEAHLVSDQPLIVEHAVDGFLKALWEAVAIVLAVSFISLGLRAGAVVAASIPLVLAIVFAVMDMTGIALQRVSLGALIIALGLLVDDAMITVEMMISRLEQGFSRTAAATYAYSTTAFPMLTGTLVTIAGFVPVGFARSSAGEYTFSLFAVIATALIVSWVVAVLFAPVLGVLMLPATARKHDRPHGGEGRGTRIARRIVGGCMRYRWVVIVATVLLFAGSIVGMRFVQQQFFPASDRNELMVDLNLPQNASIYAADDASRRLETLLAADPEIARFSSYIGQGAVRFYLPLNLQLPNDFFAQSVVVTKGLAERDRVKARLEQVLAVQFPAAVARVYPLELGPPVGWPLQYRLSGPDIEQTRSLSYRLADIVAADAAVENVNFDWGQPARTVRVEVDQDRARRLGITSERLASTLNAIASGSTITRVRDDIYQIDVVTRARDADRTSLDAISSLQVAAENGKSVPIAAFATPTFALEQPIVWRRDRLPTITVQADVVGGAQAKTVNARLGPRIAAYAETLPAGYTIEIGGIDEASKRSMRSVVAVLPMMALLMLTILMIQLHSFARLFLVLSVAPLGLIGVVAALWPTQTPLGFVAILGIIALAGMIIRNSVILIDQVAENQAAGATPWDAVLTATLHRMRPILLTAAAAVFGMIPIAHDVFWGPLAYAIIGGLLVATLLTLLFLPALYVAWFRIAAPAKTA